MPRRSHAQSIGRSPWFIHLGLVLFTTGCTTASQEESVDASGPVAIAPEVPIEISDMDVEFQKAMSAHTAERYVGTLEEIKKRGVLRVGMLNNAVSYFVYKGQEVGFQYELATLWAARLAVRLQVIVPEQPEGMMALLTDQRADMVPLRASETSPDVLETVPFVFADYQLVQNKSATPITDAAMLAGLSVHARRGSRYWPVLETLRQKVPTLQLVPSPEDVETETLIDGVGRGGIPITVSNSLLLQVERTYRDDVIGTLKVAENQGLAYGVSPKAQDLHERLQTLLKRDLQSEAYRTIYSKYFENPKRMAELGAGQLGESGAISPYDEILRRHAEPRGLDWRLLAAQMYQESRYDPNARSWVGAQGLMQLMPRTAAELGVKNMADPEENIAGGVRYLAQLAGRFEAALDPRQRVRFALASYNAGYSHVVDARLLAQKIGADPNRWFGNVERAIALLEQPKYYRKAKFGYCRGREPVEYVSRIQSKYDGFVAITGAKLPETAANPMQPVP